MTVPFKFRSDRHCRIRIDLGSLDQRTSEQGSSDEKEEGVKVTTIRSHWRVRSTDKRHCREPSCTGDNFPRWYLNPSHGFPKGLCVTIRRIAAPKVGYSKSVMRDLANLKACSDVKG